ncbi:hypothetical protein TNCV_2289751 [Trichonephila clavipes]|uniref:Transposase n=1 Tax=Trichonephila clavipes TaxID=2585209 RepID=A0A8X6RKX1_TRICX|nr:hypothetical protein TNCV_2289751 [Trichonephila clavipes]
MYTDGTPVSLVETGNETSTSQRKIGFKLVTLTTGLCDHQNSLKCDGKVFEQRDPRLSQVESHKQDSSDVPLKSNRGSINREIMMAKELVHHIQFIVPQTWHSAAAHMDVPPIGKSSGREDSLSDSKVVLDENGSYVSDFRLRFYGDRFNSCQVIYSQFGLAIHQNDHQARRKFVEWAQNEIAVVPNFHKRILFSDEAHFWLNGYVNKQNCRIWSEAKPQVYVETPLHPEKLTVWCALWAGGILLQKR